MKIAKELKELKLSRKEELEFQIEWMQEDLEELKNLEE